MITRKYSLWGEIVAYTIKKYGDYRERKSYAKTKNAIELSNLLEIQKKSYDWFMTEGIKEVFDDLFPIESFSGISFDNVNATSFSLYCFAGIPVSFSVVE